MDITTTEIWKEESKRRKRIMIWFLLVGLIFLAISITVWAMVTQPLLSSPVIKRSAEGVDPSALEGHVRMVSEKFFPRDYTHPENLDLTAGYIRQELEKRNGKVAEQDFVVNGKTYRNVIAFYGPETEERIVIGAHYDSFSGYPAADDNASGVAGLIELAGLLSKSPPKCSVELVAYTLEEPPFFGKEAMGSAVHAGKLKKENKKVRAMLSLEMIGYFTDTPNSQNFPLSILRAFYPSKGDFITVVGKLGQGSLVRKIKKAMRGSSSLPVYSINAPASIPGIDFSDHLNYWQAGYDAVMISDTAFYRNKNYHTKQDRPETLDYKRMALVVEGVYSAVISLAE